MNSYVHLTERSYKGSYTYCMDYKSASVLSKGEKLNKSGIPSDIEGLKNMLVIECKSQIRNQNFHLLVWESGILQKSQPNVNNDTLCLKFLCV